MGKYLLGSGSGYFAANGQSASLSIVAYCLLSHIIATATVSTKQETSVCCQYY
jgi:hypothetical protein